MRARAGRKTSRRQLLAQAAYDAALQAVRDHALGQLMRRGLRGGQALRGGTQRNSQRMLAMHLAREAFGAPLAAIGEAAGCRHRNSARWAVLTVWERRDANAELDFALWQATHALRGDIPHGIG